jgi:L-threonylcarbamoyladenylate synthase
MNYETDSFDGEIVRLLQNGGAGLLPTDTIYGLSGRAEDYEAVERLHKLKGRAGNKPFIILISNIKMLDLLSISDKQASAVKNYWPGALSVVFPAPDAPAWLHRGAGSLAVRLPDYPELIRLIDKTGPLVSTSANLPDQPPARTVSEAKELFGSQLDFYVDAGELSGPPSTLAALSDNVLRVIRQGAVRID